MKILINSSKTMVATGIAKGDSVRLPQLQARAAQLVTEVQKMSDADLRRIMHISPALALKTHQLYADWATSDSGLALDTFQGDIYKGLRASTLSRDARNYADQSLRILSGLYGIICPYDAIHPYRLEVGYRFAPHGSKSLYEYWGDTVVHQLGDDLILNLASEEYAKLVVPFVAPERVVSPLFLTVQKTAEPTFVAIHAKLARGAFARWVLEEHITGIENLKNFTDLGYVYDVERSTAAVPVFIRHGALTLDMIG